MQQLLASMNKPGVVQFAPINAATAATSTTGTAIVTPFSTMVRGNLAFVVTATGIDGTTGTVDLLHSADGTNFQKVDPTGGTTTITLTSATTFIITPITNIAMNYYRLDYAKGNNTTGTINATLTFS